MERSWSLRTLRLFLVCMVLFGALSAPQQGRATSMAHGARAQAVPAGYAFVHDPSMIKEGHTFYLFSTGDASVDGGNLQIRSSTNLKTWKFQGTVFSSFPAWLISAVPGVTSLWAPDISYYKGQYQVYYAASTFGSNNSVIGLATNATLDPRSPKYRWIDRGLVFESYSMDPYNAIDPNFVLDKSGHPWLAFGSFWSDLKILRLNPRTRKPEGRPPAIYSLAYQPQGAHALEASFIVYHKPYYYLFTSAGFCCRGVNSTYHIIMGRSRRITGPYRDERGTAMMNGGGTLLLGNEGPMIGPGGQSVFRDGAADYMVYHYYNAREQGQARVQVRRIFWRPDGWPVLGPPVVPVPGP